MSLAPLSANAVLKEFYARVTDVDIKLREFSPTYNRIKKIPVQGGKYFRNPYQKQSAQSVSGDYGEAFKLAVSENVGIGFDAADFPWDEYHAGWSLAAKAVKQMPAKGPGSFINAIRRLIASTRETVGKVRSSHLFGDGSGWMAQADKQNITTGTQYSGHAYWNKVTLKDPAQMCQIDRGTRFSISQTPTQNARDFPRGETKTYEVVDVNPDDDGLSIVSVLVSTTPANSSQIDVPPNWYLWRQGDNIHGRAGSPRKVLPGLAAWCPAKAQQALAFPQASGGMTRALTTSLGRDPALAGHYFDATGAYDPDTPATTGYARFEKTIDRIIEAAGIAYQRGARPEYFCVAPRLFRHLVTELGQKIEKEKTPDGLEVYMIHGGRGHIAVYEDPYCPVQDVYGLRHSDWSFVSLGNFLDQFDQDGNAVHRVQGQSDIHGMISSYATLVCSNPNNLVRIKVDNVIV